MAAEALLPSHSQNVSVLKLGEDTLWCRQSEGSHASSEDTILVIAAAFGASRPPVDLWDRLLPSHPPCSTQCSGSTAVLLPAELLSSEERHQLLPHRHRSCEMQTNLLTQISKVIISVFRCDVSMLLCWKLSRLHCFCSPGLHLEIEEIIPEFEEVKLSVEAYDGTLWLSSGSSFSNLSEV